MSTATKQEPATSKQEPTMALADSYGQGWNAGYQAAIDKFNKQEPAVPAGYVLVPIEPTQGMITAMSTSKAKDSEGEFPMLLDLIDYSGENKTYTVLKAAYAAMLAAAPTPKETT